MVSLVSERVIRRKLKDNETVKDLSFDDLKTKRHGFKRKTSEQNNNDGLLIQNDSKQRNNENIHENLLNSKKMDIEKNKYSFENTFDNNDNVKKPKLDSNIVMFKNYQPWVIKTYGDFSKTKTVTLRKYARILRALRGEEVHSADSSKFRFWVKSKGFHIGKPIGYDAKPADAIVGRFTIDDIDNADDISDKAFFANDNVKQDPALYVPTVPVKNAPVQTEPVYRKVAIVENFFDIIYNVHVELEGRPGKHAGQKRTYRTITETYAFLPREAVTKFLLGCTDCQRRPRSPSPLIGLMPIQSQQNATKFLIPKNVRSNEKPNKNESPLTVNPNDTAFPSNISFETTKTPLTPPKSLTNFTSIADLSTSTITSKENDYQKIFNKINDSDLQDASKQEACDLTLSDSKKTFVTPKTRYLGPLRRNILANQFVNDLRKNNLSPEKQQNELASTFDYNLPITTTYLKHMRNLGYTDEDALKFERYENMSTPEPPEIQEDDPYAGGRNNGSGIEGNNAASGGGLIPDLPQLSGVNPEDMAGLWASYHSALGLNKGGLLKPSNTPPAPSHREPNSPVMVETGSAHDETSSSGNKEDEDDEDDESDERIDTHSHHDPERLKAFNMFVRLFVDENLDRMVPISKQPKEKIQAIIDSCTRQFPEFAERARKRIRTYLKSCRRNKRARDPSTPWDATRPTPAHLTSVQAEQILATACENESMNAKRMRMGMEPVSQPMPLLPGGTTTDTTAPVTPNRSMDFTTSAVTSGVKVETTDSSPFTSSSTLTPVSKGGGGLSLISDAKSQGLGITANSLVTSSVTTMNGLTSAVGSTVGTAAPTAMYRPNFTQAFQRAGATGPYPPTSAIFPTTNTQQAFNLAAVSQSSSLLPNGPTDLSMNKGPQPQKPLLTHKLSGGEMTAVRQLITGYRESAAFLLRSADELEQLLLQQQQQ